MFLCFGWVFWSENIFIFEGLTFISYKIVSWQLFALNTLHSIYLLASLSSQTYFALWGNEPFFLTVGKIFLSLVFSSFTIMYLWMFLFYLYCLGFDKLHDSVGGDFLKFWEILGLNISNNVSPPIVLSSALGTSILLTLKLLSISQMSFTHYLIFPFLSLSIFYFGRFPVH